MPLQPRNDALTKESILVMGIYGSGKSNGWATIRRWYELTGTPGHFHVLSTEWEAAGRTAEGYLDGSDGNNFFSNATIYEVVDHPSMMEATEKIRAIGQPEDWFIVDSIGNPHRWTRDVWFQQHYGMGYRDFMASGKKAREVGPAGWIEIEQLYKEWAVKNVIQFPGHKYACAQATTVNTEGTFADSPALQKMYGRIGAKPEGHKELGYMFHTVLFATQRGAGDWRLTTIDDPSRTHLVDEPVPDFVTAYLCAVAGWQVT